MNEHYMTTTPAKRSSRWQNLRRKRKRRGEPLPEYRYCKDCFSAIPVIGVYDENGKKVREYTQRHTKMDCHRAQTESMLDQY